MASDDALELLKSDPVAVSIGRSVAVANRQACADAFDTEGHEVRIRCSATGEGIALWRIDYVPVPAPGDFTRRGGYMVEVNSETGAVYRALRGQ